MKPEISVIITTYNRVRSLTERSLPSVLNQTYKNFECIIVDDGSNDGAGDAVKKFQAKDNRIKYVRLPRNSGVSAARNTGVKHAAGEYISFLDDDDELLSSFLEVTLLALKNISLEFSGVAVDRIRVLENGSKIYQPINFSKGFYHAVSVGWLLRKSVFSKIHYDEDLRSDVDADFGIQFFSLFKGSSINQPLLLTYAHGEEEFGVTSPSEQRLTALDRFLKKNFDLFRSRGDKRDLEFIYRFAGQDYCRGGAMKKGIPFLWKALLTKPSSRNVLNFLVSLFGYKFYSSYWALERKFIDFLSARFVGPVDDKILTSIK